MARASMACCVLWKPVAGSIAYCGRPRLRPKAEQAAGMV
jgi:hypothetical protein